MQNRPDGSTLLDAVANFLVTEVGPRLESDKALQFRLLIAANLATIVASELRTEDDRCAAEGQRLVALLPEIGQLPQLSSPRRVERMTAIAAMEAALAARLRQSGPDDASLAHLWETAKQTLQVTNPRFDLSEEL